MTLLNVKTQLEAAFTVPTMMLTDIVFAAIGTNAAPVSHAWAWNDNSRVLWADGSRMVW